jgi:ACT domain-containing protein
MDSDDILQYINRAKMGNDYDVAKLFLAVFPDCKHLSDREISIKLSEDIHDMLRDVAQLFSKRSTEALTEHEQCKFQSVAAEYTSTLRALRTHSKKKSYIEEIKCIR